MTRTEFLDFFSKVQRPARTSWWVVLITIEFLYTIFTGGKKDASNILEFLNLGMFADMGVYSALKTYESVVKTKVDGKQNVVEAVTSADNTNIENLNVGNETVITSKPKNESGISGE